MSGWIIDLGYKAKKQRSSSMLVYMHLVKYFTFLVNITYEGLYDCWKEAELHISILTL